jgi:flagellar M-ring protein FliF
MEFLSQVYGRFLTFWGELSPRRRTSLAAIVGGCVLAVVALMAWAQRPEWTPVVGGLEPDEARLLVQSLREDGYKVQVQGDQLMVPASDLQEARLAAYGSDMGSTLPGMTLLLDRKGMGLTREQEKATYQVALQGELARTISRLSAVSRASVQLVMPREALFTEDRVEPSASVMLDLKPGKTLSREQVTSVTNLVAAAVPRLVPDDVVVADTGGNMLTRPMQQDDAAADVDRLLEYTQQIEHSLQQKAVTQLERIYGPGRALVEVTARIDTSSRESNAVDYDASGVAARSIQSAESAESGGQTQAQGVPGTGSNLPEIEARAGGGANSLTESTTAAETLNYEVPTTTEHRVQPPGSIVDLSVSVLVDGEMQLDEISGEETYVPRTEDELTQIESIVAAAVGIDPKRGDRISVANLQFRSADSDAVAVAGVPFMQRMRVGDWIGWLVLLVVIVMTYLYVLRPIISSVVGPSKEERIAQMASMAMLPDGRSADFQNRLTQLTGHDGEGDPLVAVIRENLGGTVRNLQSWIEES